MHSPSYFAPGALVAVLTSQPLGRALDYRAPEGGCFAGAFVEVPLGPRRVIGVIWGAGRGDYDPAKVRAVLRVLDVAPMRPEMRRFLERAADYTLTPLPQMLRLATRAPGLGDPPSMQRVYRAVARDDGADGSGTTEGNTGAGRLTDARRRVLAVLQDRCEAAFTQRELADLAGVSGGVIKGMAAQGMLREEESPRDAPFAPMDPTRPGKALTADQQKAAQDLAAGIGSGAYGTTLLRGVTGSGKTEVYLEAVAATLGAGRQALVLLPEIALTAEFLTRVEARFGARPAEWHSGATMTERRRIWRMVGEGGVQLVIGARSALFLPFRDLGLIVVDEEHDSSYKQEEGVLYHARDMAVLRASICGAQVVLASATPSLESWVNAQSGKYRRLDLTARFGPAVLPRMETIDMRDQSLPKDAWVSQPLREAVQARLDAGQQAMLFINRRGYAPVTLCRACGHQIGCDHCDARMVEHRYLNRLMCHQCGETRPMPDTCPSCEKEGKLAAIGPGVERLGEEAAQTFPTARIATLSSDMYGSARALKAEIEKIASGEADIIIGTQLVAKGHNFPNLTLVGVVDADLGLLGTDLRAAERTFQLMRQVAGRAGRSAHPGVALMQSYQPDHPVIRAIIAGNEEEFWAAQAAEREAAQMPPFGRLAGIILSAGDAAPAFEAGMMLARNAGPLAAIGATVFGPAPAPIARVRGRHRVRLLVKAPKGAPLQGALARWTGQLRLRGDVRLAIDIDPQSFY